MSKSIMKSDHRSVGDIPSQFPSDKPPQRPPSHRLPAHTGDLWCCPAYQTHPWHGYWGTQTPRTWRPKRSTQGIMKVLTQHSRTQMTNFIFLRNKLLFIVLNCATQYNPNKENKRSVVSFNSWKLKKKLHLWLLCFWSYFETPNVDDWVTLVASRVNKMHVGAN